MRLLWVKSTLHFSHCGGDDARLKNKRFEIGGKIDHLSSHGKVTLRPSRPSLSSSFRASENMGKRWIIYYSYEAESLTIMSKASLWSIKILHLTCIYLSHCLTRLFLHWQFLSTNLSHSKDRKRESALLRKAGSIFRIGQKAHRVKVKNQAIVN